MNIYTNPNSSFPSQVVPDEVKNSLKYGEQVAQAIESEWWRQGGNGTRFATSYNRFHSLRLYARGEQPVQKYKDELSINGDLSYLNLDWKPVPILSKFVDIVVNGISAHSYDVKAYAQDPESIKKRTEYASKIYEDMLAKEYLDNLKTNLGIDLYQVPNPDLLPESEEELELHMQLSYKQSIEIAEEEAISSVMAQNKYDLIIFDLWWNEKDITLKTQQKLRALKMKNKSYFFFYNILLVPFYMITYFIVTTRASSPWSLLQERRDSVGTIVR